MGNEKLIQIYMNRLYSKGLTTCLGGNMSIRDNDYFHITETNIDKSLITENNISKVLYDGTVINNICPSSESEVHRLIYNEFPKVNAIIHAHPPFATTYALTNNELVSALSSEMYKNLGNVIVSEYAQPGSNKLAKNICKAAKKGHTILMKNHGVIVLSETIQKAYYMIELLEELAKMSVIISIIGNPSKLEDKQLELLGGK